MNSNDSSVKWTVLLAISLSAFIVTLDSTFMNVSIKYLITDLNTTLSTIQLIIATYTLTIASLMLLGGKLQDIIGRKKIFISGAVIYGIGTLIAALSINASMLFFGWSILEGIGAALMTPAAVSIISGSYTGEERRFALGMRTAIAGVAGALGPLIGGFLTTFLSWRYGFALELVVIFVIIVLSSKIKNFPKHLDKSKLDKIGVLLSIAGLSTLVIGIWSINYIRNPIIYALLIFTGIILMALFFLYENRRINENREALTDIKLFKDRNFTAGTLIRLIIQLALAGSIFILPVFLQQIVGADAFLTGLALLPLTIGYLIFSIISSKAASHLKSSYIISSGFLVAFAGSLFLSYQFNLSTTVWQLVPGTFLLGAGIGLSLPLSSDVILSSTPTKKHSDASGIISTFSNLGSSLGTALLGVILIMGLFSGMTTAVEQIYPEKQDVQHEVDVWLEKMSTVNVQELKTNKSSSFYSLIDITVSNEMKSTFQFVSIIFLIGFVISLFIRPLKSRK